MAVSISIGSKYVQGINSSNLFKKLVAESEFAQTSGIEIKESVPANGSFAAYLTDVNTSWAGGICQLKNWSGSTSTIEQVLIPADGVADKLEICTAVFDEYMDTYQSAESVITDSIDTFYDKQVKKVSDVLVFGSKSGLNVTGFGNATGDYTKANGIFAGFNVYGFSGNTTASTLTQISSTDALAFMNKVKGVAIANGLTSFSDSPSLWLSQDQYDLLMAGYGIGALNNVNGKPLDELAGIKLKPSKTLNKGKRMLLSFPENFKLLYQTAKSDTFETSPEDFYVSFKTALGAKVLDVTKAVVIDLV